MRIWSDGPNGSRLKLEIQIIYLPWFEEGLFGGLLFYTVHGASVGITTSLPNSDRGYYFFADMVNTVVGLECLELHGDY